MIYVKKGELILRVVNHSISCVSVLFVFSLCFFVNQSSCLEDMGLSSSSQGAGKSTDHIEQFCIESCPDQNQTYTYSKDHFDNACGSDCYIEHCSIGCNLWELAIDSTCPLVCNKTSSEIVRAKELYCVKGCNIATEGYFKWIREEIGETPAPALVADSLTATSLSLEWEIPSKLIELTRGKPYSHRSYLVQWRFEEQAGDWKYCRNHSMGSNSTVRVDNLQPYTKYRFRIAIMLSQTRDETLPSKQSVVIMTLSSGKPISKPSIVRAVAVDHTRISVSWEAGPFPNGPILSYVLQIKDQNPDGYSALKDIPASKNKNFFLFENLTPNSNYSVSVQMRNEEGEGPAATMSVSTLVPPERKDDEPQPILILAAEYSILSQSPDMLSHPPKVFYTSEHRIQGIAVHIAKKVIFVSDEAGYIIRAPLDGVGEKSVVLSPSSGANFIPQLLSIDWLNDHLYILGEVLHSNNKQMWQISRCELNGRGLTVAIAGLYHKPRHIEVDPYNGYLFWVISGQHLNSGLFRLDLGDISNGVKHEDKPMHLIANGNLGAFTVDHIRYRVLVAVENNHTVIAVSLDGKDQDDIRNAENIQQSRFLHVKSLAYANGLFYWSNGNELLAEEFHLIKKIYYHNAYPDLNNTTFVAVCVRLPSAQPIPIPVNPPSNVQALLTDSKGKVSWQIPHLLGNQGKGTWQEWYYELQVKDDNNTVMVIKKIRATTYTVTNLHTNTNYTFRAAAYTPAGQGPWSTEFKSKTLRTSHERSLLWSSNNGVMKTDVMGEHLETIIPIDKMESYVNDIAWYEDLVYILSNSTLTIYNQTSRDTYSAGIIGKKVDRIAIDWVGKQLYWSDEMTINRGDLQAKNHNPLRIYYGTLRSLKVDSKRGNMYYSTYQSVETCRLNGKRHKYYYQNDVHYSGKQVMGMTIDYDNDRIYWLIRTYDKSTLIMAPLADNWITEVPPTTEIALEQLSRSGPLVHFSDRLLWLQNNYTAIIADEMGHNIARIVNAKLEGIETITLVDPTHRLLSLADINVIPTKINSSTISIVGTWDSFKVMWEREPKVNYGGNVTYEIIVQVRNKTDAIFETENNFIHYNQGLLPYTPIHVSIKSFTFWASSPTSQAHLYSPPSAPSQPTNPRIFISHIHDPMHKYFNIEATFRWGKPLKPNGHIIGYRVYYRFIANDVRIDINDGFDIDADSTEFVVSNLDKNVTYEFDVKASTGVGSGDVTIPISINTSQENPVPRIVISQGPHIYEVDFDLETATQIITTTSPIRHLAQINREKRLIWINENNELIMALNQTVQTKLFSLSATALSLTVDWIERVIYWSQTQYGKAGTRMLAFDMNKFDIGAFSTYEVFSSLEIMESLQVSPNHRELFWVDRTKTHSELMSFSLKTRTKSPVFRSEEASCVNYTSNVGRVVTLDTLLTTGVHLIWSLNSATATHLYSTNIRTKKCHQINIPHNILMTHFVKDSGHIYFTANQTINAINFNTNIHNIMSMTIPRPIHSSSQITSIVANTHQLYPPQKCLIPIMKSERHAYVVSFKAKTENSITLGLPQAEVYPDCIYQLQSIKYTILYKRYQREGERCNATVCDVVESFDTTKVVEGLLPFTKYQFTVGVNSYYGEKLHYQTSYGPMVVFQTAPGAPPSPEHVTAEAIGPHEAMVQWMPSKTINSDTIWYEVHWQMENTVNGVKNRQQQLVKNISSLNENDINGYISRHLTRLLPNQVYSVCVRVYTSIETFAESEEVKIQTFPVPENITAQLITANTMQIEWSPTRNISRFVIQYVSGGTKNTTIVYDSKDGEDLMTHTQYTIDNLQPKTQYMFSILIYYPRQKKPYVWPSDGRFVFETTADCPTAPGKPMIEQLNRGLYQVSWSPAKDNGAFIEQYSLEAKNQSETTRVTRSATLILNETINGIPMINESEPIEHQWSVYYNGTDTYWIPKELQSINLYVFRVRARNVHGWGGYSLESEPLSPEPDKYSPPENDYFVYSALFLTTGILIVLFTIIFFFFCRPSTKKIIHDTDMIMRIPDVELATLRNMPRRSCWITSTNILYNTGPLNESDIAALPQIKREQITMTDFLGSGAFGEVYEGCVTNVDGETEIRVAIKTLRKGATDQEKGEFLQEAQLMSNFKHEHILRLIGICLDKDSLYIIMELMQGGDLLSYLRQCRPTNETPSSLTLVDLLSMCVDVASGCRYLEDMHFVHRDLACRNCLVSSVDPANRVVKIGDFGLARDIYKNDYYRKEGGLLPVRWMSPESLVDGIFTSQSDIWAFGVLCWEILTLGQQPYPARNNVEVLHFVKEGGRLGRPTDCPDELYQLMLKCWSYSPEDRPTFRYCLEVLQDLYHHTSDAVKITMQYSSWPTNGGIFNRTYLLQSDENHNHNTEGIIKYESNELSSTELNAALATPPTSLSSSTATTIPKYLELIYGGDENSMGTTPTTTTTNIPNHHLSQPKQITHIPAISSHHLQQSQQQHHYHPQLHGDGYETPITIAVTPLSRSSSNSLKNNRSFSNSSTVSERSSILGCINNNNLLNSNTIDVSNKILKVALPPPLPADNGDSCTSMDTLLPNAVPPPPSQIQKTHQMIDKNHEKSHEGRTVI